MPRRLTDRKSIIEWAEAHNAGPARVAHPAPGDSDPGLRLEFKGNGHGSDEILTRISWDEWFRTFERHGLALLVDDPDAFTA